MPAPFDHRSTASPRLRFGKSKRLTKATFGLPFLFALTAVTSVLLVGVSRLYHPHFPVLVALTLIPPTLATCTLLVATKYEVWKGVLIGAILATMEVSSQVYSFHKWKIRNFHDWSRIEIGDFTYPFYFEKQYLGFWLAFVIASFPLVGGCAQAILKRHTLLGMYLLLASFAYFYSLHFYLLWNFCHHYYS